MRGVEVPPLRSLLCLFTVAQAQDHGRVLHGSLHRLRQEEETEAGTRSPPRPSPHGLSLPSSWLVLIVYQEVLDEVDGATQQSQQSTQLKQKNEDEVVEEEVEPRKKTR